MPSSQLSNDDENVYIWMDYSPSELSPSTDHHKVEGAVACFFYSLWDGVNLRSPNYTGDNDDISYSGSFIINLLHQRYNTLGQLIGNTHIEAYKNALLNSLDNQNDASVNALYNWLILQSGTAKSATPTNVSVTGNNISRTLTWNDNTCPDIYTWPSWNANLVENNEQGFRIYKKVTSSSWDGTLSGYSLVATVGQNITSWSDNTVLNGHHSYVVVAYNNSGNSMPSAEHSVYYETQILPGIISSNTTLSGNYIANNDVTVNNGVTLTIEEGTNLAFQNGSYLKVDGTLNVNGTSGNKVVFDFVAKNSSTQNGIRTSFYADVNIAYAIIKNAYRGLNIQRSNLTFNNSEIKNCTFGLLMYYVDPGVTTNIITNSKFHDNSTGVYLYDNEYVEFSNNELYDNNYGLQVKYSDYNIFTNNEFDGNSTGAYLYYSNGKFSNNEFHGYQDVGLHCYRSSPTLAVVGVATGHNNIHENFVGIEAENNSNPFLGRVTCIDNGGYNIISNNIDVGIIAHNNCNIYAHKNYWETFASTSAVYDNSSLDMSFPLSSPPSMSYSSGGSSEEEAFDLQFSQQLSKANNSSEELKISTSDIPVGYNKAWNIEWKLLYARNLITVKNYNAAAKICKSVITEYPDSSLSYLALDLLDKASIRGKRKTDFTQFVQSKASLKSKKQLFGSAELLLAVRETKNKISALDRIEDKYNGTSLVEFVLYDKFLHYLDEENNVKLAEATSAKLGKLFPKSSSYYHSQKRLGKDVERPQRSASQLNKENSEEEVTEIPKTYALLGNYPNPFNPSTTISYALPYSSNVELTIYDITGKVVKVFNENVQSAGYQNIVWRGNNQHGSRVSSGVYFYRFKASSIEGNGKVFEKTAKMLLLK